MPFATCNDHRIYYEDSGGSGPALLFSHGFLLDHTMWHAQVGALRDAYRCITWDERGHGMSECKGPFDFYDSAADGVALLDHLGIDAATWVGMSQGGFLSMRAAVRHPQRVRALVLIDTGARLFPAEVIEGYRATQEAWLEQGPVGEIATSMAALLFGPDHDARDWIGKWQSKPPQDQREPWITVIGRDEFHPQLAGITCPSLVFQGSEDQAFDLATAEDLRDALGNCQGLVVIEGAHHAPNYTHPEQLNPPLRDFLKQWA